MFIYVHIIYIYIPCTLVYALITAKSPMLCLRFRINSAINSNFKVQQHYQMHSNVAQHFEVVASALMLRTLL